MSSVMNAPVTQPPRARVERRSDRRYWWLPLLFLAPVIVLTVRQVAHPSLSWRYVLLPIALAVSYAAWRSRHRRFDRGSVVAGILVFGGTLLITEMPLLTQGGASLYALAVRAAPLALAAAVLFCLDIEPDPLRRGRLQSQSTIILAAAAAIFTLLLFALVHYGYAGKYGVHIDGNLYVLQSSLVREPGYVRHIDADLRPFFAMRQTVFDNGRFYGQYPPGWPALLAGFDAIGLRWWSIPVLGGAAALFIVLIGARLYSRMTGFIAALLFATTAEVLVSSGGYVSHIPSAALTTIAAWLLLRAEDRTGWWQNLHCALGGFVIGMVTAVRPMTGVAVGLSLCSWMAFRRGWKIKEAGRLALAVALGGIVPALLLMHYNAVTNGSPLEFGYTAANGSLHNLGFGLRGVISYDDLGRPVPVTTNFTPRLAVTHLLRVCYDFNTQIVPLFLTAPILLVGLIYRFRYRWWVIASFLLLPIAQFFWYYYGVRFITELYPFLFVGLAAILVHVWQRNRRLAVALVVCLSVAQVTTAVTIAGDAVRRNRTMRPYFERVAEAQSQYGKILLFVDDPPLAENLLESLSWFNSDPFPGDIVVARDLGVLDTVLMRRLPAHQPLWITAAKSGESVPPLKRLTQPVGLAHDGIE